MAKVELKCRIYLEEGVSKIESGKFNTPVRSMDYQDPLDYGDVFTIPTDYEVLGKIIDSFREDAKPIPFIYVDVKNSMKSSIKKIKFFPNQLAKVVFPVNDSGQRLPKVKTMGTAAAYYATFNNVDDAMESLKGKTIRVSDKTYYRTERYGDHDIVDTCIYEYNFGDNNLISKMDAPFLRYNENQRSIVGVHNGNIEKVYIPDCIADIEDYAFCGCERLFAVYLNKVVHIKKYAFGDCLSLKRIDIPWTTEFISSEAFVGCKTLEEINVQSERYHAPISDCECDIPVEGYCSIDGILYKQYHDSRKYILTLKLVPQNHRSSNLVLPNNVKKIAYGAFRDCNKIKSVTLPSGLEDCSDSAFIGCDSLDQIIVPRHSLEKFRKLLSNYKHLLIEQN